MHCFKRKQLFFPIFLVIAIYWLIGYNENNDFGNYTESKFGLLYSRIIAVRISLIYCRQVEKLTSGLIIC